MISFVHCGDLHLGIMPEKNASRFKDFFDAFSDCIDFAMNKKVDFIIVAGDMFHQKTINSKTLLLTSEILKKAKDNNIPVLVIEGNHDRAFYIDEDSWLSYLDNEGLIYLLSVNNINGNLSINKEYEKDTYRVVGVGYLGGATEKYIDEIKYLLPIDRKTNILVMHAAIDKMKDQNMGDVSSDKIKELENHCAYLALGHIHYKYELDDFAFNPGSLENLRTKDEISGKKGFYYVQIDEASGAKNVEYIDSKRRPIRYKSLDCTNIETPDGVLDYLISEMEKWNNINEGNIIYLSLNGKTSFNPLLIDSKAIKQLLQDKFNPLYIEIVNIINDSNPIERIEDGVNVEAIVEAAIEKQIRYDYPATKNPTNLAKLMRELSELIQNGSTEKDTFELLMRKEDLE